MDKRCRLAVPSQQEDYSKLVLLVLTQIELDFLFGIQQRIVTYLSGPMLVLLLLVGGGGHGVQGFVLPTQNLQVKVSFIQKVFQTVNLTYRFMTLPP